VYILLVTNHYYVLLVVLIFRLQCLLMFYLLSITIMNEFSQVHMCYYFHLKFACLSRSTSWKTHTSTYSCKLFSTFIISLLDHLFLKLVHIVIYLIYLFKHYDLLDVGIIYWARFLSIFCTCAMNPCYLVH
jgi:hypothetical protein